MSLRDANTRYSALKLLADIVDQAMKAEKADHLDQLEASADESGAKSWDVNVAGEKVASITLSKRTGGPKITDEPTLAEWLDEHRPEMVEHVVRIRPWAAKQLLASIVEVVDDGGVTEEGEILPGITETPDGTPYQSLRWAKSKGDATGDEHGRHVLADAIRSGELAHLLEDAGIPLIRP